MPTDTTTTSTTTPLTAPLPASFEGTLPSSTGSICEQLSKAAQFDAVFLKFYQFMFNPDGSLTDSFKNQICAIDCFTTVSTASTTGGTGTTTSTTTVILPDLVWTAKDSNRNWVACCSSQSGTKMAAVETGGQIYISTDSGATWTAVDSIRNWTSICCSADFTILYAGTDDDGVYFSVDSGATWTHATGISAGTSIRGVGCSSDGSIAQGVGWKSGTYTYGINYIWGTTDSGTTWVQVAFVPETAQPIKYSNVLLKADGTRLTIVQAPGFVFSNAPYGNYQNACCRSTGDTILSGQYGGPIWQSNPGAQLNSSRLWRGVACNLSGNRVVAVAESAKIQESQSAGATWVEEDSARAWRGVAGNADGSRWVAVVFGGKIYIGA